MRVGNLIDGALIPASETGTFAKRSPSDGAVLCEVPRSAKPDVDAAVGAAERAQPEWAARTAVERGELARELALALRDRREEAAKLVADETGKPMQLALGETDAAVEMGFFAAGEGR